MNYVLLTILLICSVVIIITVLFQKSSDSGLSSTISGGSETYYGRDKSAHTEKRLFKITLVISLIFAVAVLVAYIVQPDYDGDHPGLLEWQEISQYHESLGHDH